MYHTIIQLPLKYETMMTSKVNQLRENACLIDHESSHALDALYDFSPTY